MLYAVYLQFAAAIFAFAAAVFWFRSSRVDFPKFEGWSGGEAGIHDLGNAVIQQSNLSKYAAFCAGTASILEVAYLIFNAV